MARRKGLKIWNRITREGWLSLLGDPTVMTGLMMAIFDRLYHAEEYTDNAKNIADALHMEYRALNAGVGWAGNKIRKMAEGGLLPVYPEKDETPAEEMLSAEGADVPAEKAAPKAGKKKGMAPWEYLFDGSEGEDGAYFWTLKPEAAAAFREYVEADLSERDVFRRLLEEDVSASGVEGSLFSQPPEKTIARIRTVLEKEAVFRRKSFEKDTCCTVCGGRRVSLLRSVPYGEEGNENKGLVFCPTHGSLFAAHLITYNDKGELLISRSLDEEDRKAYGLTAGAAAKNSFSRRRMTVHRRIFNQEERKIP